MSDLKLYFHNLSNYDYVGFIFLGIVTILIFLIAIILLFKRRFLSSFFFIFLLIIIWPIGIFGIKHITDATLRRPKIDIKEIKSLHFSNSLLLVAKLTNVSKIDYKQCYINFKLYKKGNNKIKNFLYSLKPIKNRTILIAKSIGSKESIFLKRVLNNIYFDDEKMRYQIKGTCY